MILSQLSRVFVSGPIIYGIDLLPADFRWLSAQISAVAGEGECVRQA
jgi:hypothetical protein